MIRSNKILEMLKYVNINQSYKKLTTAINYIEEENIKEELYVCKRCKRCHGIGWLNNNKEPIGLNINYKICNICNGLGYN